MNLEFDFIIAKIIRDNANIVPKGNITLQENDRIVFAGKQYFDPTGTDLQEFKINSFHSWVDQDIISLDLPDDYLIILVLRENNRLVVPTGSTQILEGDTVIALDPHKRV